MRKRIAFVTNNLTGGGAERVVSILATQFAEQGIDTSIILMTEGERTYFISPKVRTIDAYCPIKSWKVLWHIKRLVSLRKAIKKSKADTIISFIWDTNLKVILSTIGMRKKIIISERADPAAYYQKLSFRFGRKYIYPKADAIVFQTDEAKSYYLKTSRQKQVVIVNPVERAPEFEGKRDKRIVAVGRLTEQKNYKLLIDAFFMFYQSHKDYILEIYGSGPKDGELKAYVKELDLESAVIFKGYATDVKEKILSAGVYVNSSDYEGISNAMLEALAMGIPSVCTDCPVGGARAVIENGINGILVPVNNKEALVDAVCRLVDDSELSKSISTKARLIGDKYSAEHIANEWIALC